MNNQKSDIDAAERDDSEIADERDPPPPYRPPLPPRESTGSQLTGAGQDLLTVDEASSSAKFHSQSTSLSWIEQDPRSKSTESLVPRDGPDGKRTLLIIYIHGFLGDETSFQSFPAHVHNVVAPLVKQTHVVHTKIYPKYRSRKVIEFARDDFSRWVSPHESDDTDIILCGHSMGGLVSAEVALMPPASTDDPKPFKHRILGTINFDVPFLGMHPGVVWSGISSLFRPTPKSPDLESPCQSLDGGSGSQLPLSLDANSSPSSSNLSIPLHDPNYNPPFPNDVHLPVRKKWDSAMHFVTKHSDGLTRATKSYVTSHLEFGGAMANYKSLQSRYKAIRILEDRDSPDPTSYRVPWRVRFINYYTASTGILKPQEDTENAPDLKAEQTATPDLSISSPPASAQARDENHLLDDSKSARSTNSLASHEISDDTGSDALAVLEPKPSDLSDLDDTSGKDEQPLSKAIDSGESTDPAIDSSTVELKKIETLTATGETSDKPSDAPLGSTREASAAPTSPSIDGLPELPPLPEQPSDFDPAQYADKDARQVAQRDHERQLKAYTRALRDREQAVRERQRLIERREKQAAKEQRDIAKAANKKDKDGAQAEEKRRKDEARAAAKREKEELKQEAKTLKAEQKAAAKEQKAAKKEEEKRRKQQEKEAKPRELKFCMLPPKLHGDRDPTWVPVKMRGVDEVGAHCGLFDAGRDHYEEFVSRVGVLIQSWVDEDVARRTAS